MDFFTSQDVARKKTSRLVLLFIVAVFCIIALVYGAVITIVRVGESRSNQSRNQPTKQISIWQPQIAVGVALGVTLIVVISSSWKVSQLGAGGHVVAEMLGGRRLDPNTSTGPERKLLNVVEEMAIASGTPVPPVYLIDEEGINAFAAGYTINDAVIGVTRGAVETLTRDELQGVIAHEFSHILNGDMRLNIRLMGAIFGIIVLSIIGYQMMRIGFYSSAGSRRNKDNSGAVIGVLGLAIMVIGYIGTFFGNLIKAAVSRQREYLADASAVQFTRNPEGISGALKKIGGWSRHSRLEHPQAAEVSHMLFGPGTAASLSSLFATHPPLEDRIKRLDPSFSGRFGETHALSAADSASELASGFAGGSRPATAKAAPPLPAQPPRPAASVEQIGRPSMQHLDYAGELIRNIPKRVMLNVREPFGARAVIYALLINDEGEARTNQIDRLKKFADTGVYDETIALMSLMKEMDPAARLPLVDLTIPALRTLSAGQYGSFCANIDELIRADQKLDLFEWTLQRILRHHLDPTFHGTRPTKVRPASLRVVSSSCSVLLSTLAYIGQSNQDDATRAFAAARAKISTVDVKLMGAAECGIRSVSQALDELADVAPKEKRRLLEACAACIAADRTVTVREAELFRAICDTLACPMPPFLPGQPLAA